MQTVIQSHCASPLKNFQPTSDGHQRFWGPLLKGGGGGFDMEEEEVSRWVGFEKMGLTS